MYSSSTSERQLLADSRLFIANLYPAKHTLNPTTQHPAAPSNHHETASR